MAALNLVLLFVIAGLALGVVGVAWVVAGAVVVIGRRRRWHPAVRCGPLVAVALGTVALAVTACWGVWWSTRPSTAFADVFSREPDASIRDLHSQTWQLGDTGSVDAWFRCSPATFEALTSGYDSSGDYASNLMEEIQRVKPFGWEPAARDALVVRTRADTWPGYAHSATVVGFDAEHGIAFVHRWGID